MAVALLLTRLVDMSPAHVSSVSSSVEQESMALALSHSVALFFFRSEKERVIAHG